ncbi:nuclear transport factor 2 family protein [Agromyces sp. G08B096]|uniref:Nuclear transport factor 2 family protein n=1 Tax=Agromyces sp. G08B096 TaxID=3156399 RepID=A0AAU7W783_9MICO
MTTITDRYLTAWNSTDPSERARLLAEHWRDDATYTDPLVEVTGRDAIAATMAAVQTQFPGFVFSLIGTPDTHHRQTRFQWGLGPEGAEPPIVGFDVIVADEDGRIQQVLGFLDRVPA